MTPTALSMGPLYSLGSRQLKWGTTRHFWLWYAICEDISIMWCNGIINGTMHSFDQHNQNQVLGQVMPLPWASHDTNNHQLPMTLMPAPVLALAQNSYITSKQSSQQDKCNGVIEGTNSTIWQETCNCHISQKLICSSNATYKPLCQFIYVHMTQLCQYICLIWTQCNHQCDQEYWYTYISHY